VIFPHQKDSLVGPGTACDILDPDANAALHCEMDTQSYYLSPVSVFQFQESRFASGIHQQKCFGFKQEARGC